MILRLTNNDENSPHPGPPARGEGEHRKTFEPILLILLILSIFRGDPFNL